MATENRFNLVDEPWIPVVDHGRVSLRDIFSNRKYPALGGNPVQKIALTKLLLAIAQAAETPEDDDAWETMGADGMAANCISYLNKWHDRFWLYGEKPFLQMPAIQSAKVQNYGAVQPEVSSGNTTVLTESSIEQTLNDTDKVLLLLVQMGFALGGKKTDNSVVLSDGYFGKSNDKGRPGTGRVGPSIGFLGYLHNFLLGGNLVESVYLNLMPKSTVGKIGLYPAGVGNPPWEYMPTGEDCDVARKLKQSMQGRLVPFSRFCLLKDDGIHYSEGILHPSHKDGIIDPSVAVNFSGKDPKAIWADPDKRPWRFLTALLSFFSQEGKTDFECFLIKYCLPRLRANFKKFGIWSGGLRVSSNAGEQYVSGTDDYVESSVWLETEWLGSCWYEQLKNEMKDLETIANLLYGKVLGFNKDLNVDGKKKAGQASSLFWTLCEQDFQNLVNSCVDIEQIRKIRRIFAGHVFKVYDTFCPRESARQLDAWARNRPNLSKYQN